jgi:hypothetical protein
MLFYILFIEIYYSTHQYFLSKRCIYILVWNLSCDYKTSKIEFWLHSIKARSKDVSVFIIGTHLDSQTKDTAEYLQEKLKSEYQRLFPRLILHFGVVSCSNGEGIIKLRNEIEEVVLNEYRGEEVPTSFLLLEKQLMHEAELRMPPIIDKKCLALIASMCNITDEKQLSRASKTLHELGSLVYFESDLKLNDLVVLDPKWLTDIMATIFTTKHNFASKDGLLSHRDLPQIWKAPKYPPSLYKILLSLLENFEVAFPLSPFTEELTGESLIPSMLPEGNSSKFLSNYKSYFFLERPSLLEEMWPKMPHNILQFGRHYKFNFIPFGMFGRLMVRIMRTFVVNQRFQTAKIYWRNGIAFNSIDRDQEKLLFEVFPEKNVMEIWLRTRFVLLLFY